MRTYTHAHTPTRTYIYTHIHTRLYIQDLAFVRSMEPRIASARAQILKHLSPAMESALSDDLHSVRSTHSSSISSGDNQTAAALHCAHAYAELGEGGPAEVCVCV